MQSDLHAAIHSNVDPEIQQLLDLLLHRRKKVLAELNRLNALITFYQNGSSTGELKVMPPPPAQIKTKKTRVRGVLAAARKAIEQLPGPFDKNQLLAKLVEIDQEFAQKKITGANIRNALRLMTQDGVIKLESEATATTCARYVKVE